VTVRPATGQFRGDWFDDIDEHGKLLSPTGQIAVSMLMVSPEVYAQDLAFLAGIN